MQIVEENEFSNAAQAASEGGEHVWTYEESGGFNADLKAARFRLGNGLRALLMVDPRAPVFAYQTWFHVGSKNENPERTGLAHLFEHLMFKGTQTHPAGVFDKEMERRGTQTNAATWVDWTYYTQSLAARGDNLEALMGFESDRMQNLLLDDETFTSEMEVVKNERRMVVDNSVSGTLNEALFETAYKEHSYRWPTIGKMEHLEETTLEDARDFYQAHYTPNNATVVIVGDINLVQTLKLLAKYYGAIPARSPQKSVIKEEPVQTEERRVVIQRPMAATQVVMAFHVPDQRHDDYAPLEFLGEILLAGDNARLYRRLVVKEELASDVGGYMTPFAHPGLFDLSMTLRSDIKLDDALKAAYDELSRSCKGFEEWEMEKARSALEIGHIYNLKDPEGIAEALGHNETNYDDFTLAFSAIQRFENITMDDLCRVAKKYLNPANCTIAVAEPEEENQDV